MNFQLHFLIVALILTIVVHDVSQVNGQTEPVPNLPVSATELPIACDESKCTYHYDQPQNLYIITAACESKNCFCPIEILMEDGTDNGEAGVANQEQGNQAQRAADTITCTGAPITLRDNEILVSLRNNTETTNLALSFKNPDKLPEKSLRFQIKSATTDVDYKWEVKVTYDPGAFSTHKHDPPNNSTNPRTGFSGVRYSGGSFSDFPHYDEAASKKSAFEFNRNYRVEITRGN